MKSGKKLVIVESPTKARTIGRILGEGFLVTSSMGHLIDLPQRQLGVDVDNGFVPRYVVMKSRQSLLSKLKKEAAGSQEVYVATDPDREGEAIGWHIKERLPAGKKILRVVFHEITPQAVKNAFGHPREFDASMIEAQTGRRVLDRIVGYYLSPLLWKKMARGLSAGRVQSVALRIIVERERQIESFVPREYWEIEALLGTPGGADFSAKLDKEDGEKIEIKNREEADSIAEKLGKSVFSVASITRKEKKRNPEPPFITSTLQQEGFNKLKFNSSRTMQIAQQLYEGVDLAGEGPVGLITYMRTDSTNVAASAVKEARDFIKDKYGAEYLPDKPNVYKSRKNAQEAHEAIRPSAVSRSPEQLRDLLTPEQYKLYELIYRRFISSQMTPARYSVTSVSINAGVYSLSASGSRLVFDGCLSVYRKEEEPEEGQPAMPELKEGDILQLRGLNPSQHFTKPPPRFSDSSLVKTLEEEGIGRPSTYAPIIQTLLLRDYVRRIKGYFHPTELGGKVCDLLVRYFPGIMDVKFTARMEEKLDGIEEGKLRHVQVLEEFYQPFKQDLDFAQGDIKKEVVVTGEACEKCGKPMVVKWGRKGKFLSCSGFPECKHAKSITTGVKCPQPGCAGELIERHSRRGVFYGCSRYPECRYVSSTLPGETK
ncbi:MAG: type I DNA topoisomerase [Candidatus Omnitrophica bacterium]|jgi:DNA topoisomerase-1|nr:type I DNA topoisomerase [Candidatus Omnitrophota bacterium]MDD5526784.1 type I DNA topoisomerase [Candidatus Omnitrophota bacterium]